MKNLDLKTNELQELNTKEMIDVDGGLLIPLAVAGLIVVGLLWPKKAY